MTLTLPFGTWPSPLTAHDVAAGVRPIDAARFVGSDVWWSERVPAEAGRTAIRRRTGDGTVETVLPAPWDARSRVHEYGGGAWTARDDGVGWFVEKSDQRVYEVVPEEAPRPLTPGRGRARFADLTLAGDELLAVRETHAPGAAKPERDIVAIPLDGSAADDAARIRRIVAGSDFLGYPRVSGDGTRLAWIAWDHPRMPWDGAELRVGRLDDGVVDAWQAWAGGPAESVVQPEWSDDDTLLVSSDRSGWWNLHRVGERGMHAVAAAEAETGGALWNLGARWFLPLDDGRVVAVRTRGADELVILGDTGEEQPIPTDADSRIVLDDARGSRVLLHGAGTATLGGLWVLDVDDPDRPQLIRAAADDPPDPAWLPSATAVVADGPDGPVHAFAYPPTNPGVVGPVDQLPPYLVLAHGGPTSHVAGAASLDIAYFTIRGIGVLDVNYGGSTGYGRAYRERLAGRWGLADAADVIAAATDLAERGSADSRRLAIRGGSAGGWTVLCALATADVFAAGISRYGVVDLRAMAADTHDFEARYLDGLVGPLPEAEELYVSRSPLSHLDRFATPLLIEQGLDDLVVPPAQSEAMRDALAARGIRHAYLAFEGEGHGFRRAETIVRALEAELSFLGQVLGFDTPDVPRLALED